MGTNILKIPGRARCWTAGWSLPIPKIGMRAWFRTSGTAGCTIRRTCPQLMIQNDTLTLSLNSHIKPTAPPTLVTMPHTFLPDTTCATSPLRHGSTNLGVVHRKVHPRTQSTRKPRRRKTDWSLLPFPSIIYLPCLPRRAPREGCQEYRAIQVCRVAGTKVHHKTNSQCRLGCELNIPALTLARR